MKKNYKLLLVIIAILLCISVGIFVRKYIINKNNPKEKNQIIELSEINNKYELKLLKSYDDYKNSKIYTERDLKNQNFKVHNYILLNIYNSDERYSLSNVSENNGTAKLLINANVYKKKKTQKNASLLIRVSKKCDTINEKNVRFEINYIDDSIPDTIDKPMIYIYPTNDIDLKIKLVNDDKLTHTYPKYNNEWNVHVAKDGNIYDYKTKRNYYALYWEGIDNTSIDMNEGFVVKGEQTVTFLENKLSYLGLNDKEINEFIVYWLNKMEDNNYNFIRFRTMEEINEYMPLEFSQKPDTLIRVIMDFKPLNEKIDVKEQKLEKVERKGFAIVEWGGREIK